MSSESPTPCLNLNSRLVLPRMLYIRSLAGKFCYSLLASCHTELHRPLLRGRVNRLLVQRTIIGAFVKYTSSGNVSLQIYIVFMVFTALNELIRRILHNAESCEHYSAWLQTLFICLPVLSLPPARAQSNPVCDGVAEYRWSLQAE